jgi:cell division protein FtsQ
LQSVAEETYRCEDIKSGNRRFKYKGGPSDSWFSLAEANADRVARAGFVLSMMFLAASAIYGLFLAGAVMPVVSELAAAADRAAFDAGFRVEDLAVSGSRNTPRAALIEALNLPYSGSSLFYDAAAARDRLSKLGWIETAEVSRILPSRLEVALSERAPFARWADAAGKINVIDRKGHVLGRAEEARFGTLLLYVGEGAPADAAAFKDALTDHQGIERRIERAEFVAERFWMVRLDSGLVLKLPRKVTALVLERLDSLLANPRIAGMALETIDLRLSNRTILQLREPTVANRDRAIALLTSSPVPAALPLRKGKAL